MTIDEAYNDLFNNLKLIYEEREADNIADWVFESVTHLKKWQRRRNSKKITAKQEVQLKKYLQELLRHKPVQYVLNEAWFYKIKFFVNEHVLIPRPETEELVSWIIKDVRNAKYDTEVNRPINTGVTILDIGTGSGCIAISIKKELKNVDVTSIDVSEHSLSVAKKNANDLHAKIDFVKSDFLEESSWPQLGKYDIIVSNPPYIPENEKEILSKNVTAFEPGLALFVHNDDPFIFYNKISKFAQSHLLPHGKIYVEIHEKYANEVKRIFTACNFKTEIKEDIYGKERMIKAVL